MEQPLAGTTSDSQQSSGGGLITATGTTNTVIHHQHQHQHHGDHQSSVTATLTSAPINAVGPGVHMANMSQAVGVPNGIGVSQRDYYPSPPSTETESSGSVIQPLQPRRYTIQGDTANQQQLQLHQLHQHQHQHHQQGDTTTSSSNNSQSGQILENGRYPEYKH